MRARISRVKTFQSRAERSGKFLPSSNTANPPDALVFTYWQQADFESIDLTILYVPRVTFSLTDSSSDVMFFGLFVSRLEGRQLLCVFKLEFPTSSSVDMS